MKNLKMLQEDLVELKSCEIFTQLYGNRTKEDIIREVYKNKSFEKLLNYVKSNFVRFVNTGKLHKITEILKKYYDLKYLNENWIYIDQYLEELFEKEDVLTGNPYVYMYKSYQIINTRIDTVKGCTRLEMYGSSRVESLHDESNIDWMSDSSIIGKMYNNSKVFTMKDFSSVGCMYDNTSIFHHEGNSSVDNMYGHSRIFSSSHNTKIGTMNDYTKTMLSDSSVVMKMKDYSKITSMNNMSKVHLMCDSSSIDKMKEYSSIDVMQGTSTVNEMYDNTVIYTMQGTSFVNYCYGISRIDRIIENSKIQHGLRKYRSEYFNDSDSEENIMRALSDGNGDLYGL